MPRLTRLLVALALVVFLAAPRGASACPFCQDGVKAPAAPEQIVGDTDPFREARAYHLSVYLMVGMPFLCLGVVGFKIYRGVKQNALAAQFNADLTQAGEEGTAPCQNLSRDDIS